jgi:hypothetical protein
MTERTAYPGERGEPIDCLLCHGEGLVAEDIKVYECPLCDGWGWVHAKDGQP